MKDSHRPVISENVWSYLLFLVAAVVFIVIYINWTSHEHVATDTFIGMKACQECHPEQCQSWGETRMAQTFDVLRPGVKQAEKEMVGLDPNEDYTLQETCLPCHTTGYGLVGGFRSIEETPEMAGVSCEACHGPGGMYVETVMSKGDPTFQTEEARQAGLIYPPTAKVCLKCHNDQSPFVGMDYVFDYEERKDSGTHEHYKLKYEHK